MRGSIVSWISFLIFSMPCTDRTGKEKPTFNFCGFKDWCNTQEKNTWNDETKWSWLLKKFNIMCFEFEKKKESFILLCSSYLINMTQHRHTHHFQSVFNIFLHISFPLPWWGWQSTGKARLHSTPSRCGRETAPPLWDQTLTLQSAYCQRRTKTSGWSMPQSKDLKDFEGGGGWAQWDWWINCICHFGWKKMTFTISWKSIKCI